MNKIFKIIWNHATQSFVAVSELAKANGKSSTTDERGTISNVSAKGFALSAVAAASLLALSQQASAAVAITATGANTVTATAGTNNNIIIGNATASGSSTRQGIAIGQNAMANSTAGGIAIGENSTTGNGQGNTVIGRGAVVLDGLNQSTAIGGAQTDTKAVGGTGYQSTATFKTDAATKTAIQFDTGGAVVAGDQSIAIGSNVLAKGNSSIAIGNDDLDKASDKVGATFATLTGGTMTRRYYVNTGAYGDASVAIGVQAGALGDLSVALGARSVAADLGAVALGVGADASKRNSVAIGLGSNTNTSATNEQSATIRTADGRTMTYGGTTPETRFAGNAENNAGDQVSFGSPGYERQLKNVSAGNISKTSTDAINGSQLFAVIDTIAKGVNYYVEDRTVATNKKTTIVPGGNVTFSSGQGTSVIMGADGSAHGSVGISYNVKYDGTSIQLNNKGELMVGPGASRLTVDVAAENGTLGAVDIVGAGEGNANNVVGDYSNPESLVFKAGDNIQLNQTGTNITISAVIPEFDWGFNVTSAKSGTGTNDDGTVEVAPVAKNDTVTYTAGDNVNIAQTDKNFTFSVKSTELKAEETSAADNTPTGKVATPTNGSSLVNASTVANAINNAGWKVTSDLAGTGTRTGKAATTELVQAGETVTFKAGDNLDIEQAENVFTYKLAKDVSVAGNLTVAGNTTVNNFTVNPNSTVNMGGNTVGGVQSNLPGTTKADNSPIGTAPTEFSTAPENLADIKHNAATVEDVLNSGWNLQENDTAKDFVKAYDTVNFIDGAGTKANITMSENGTVADIKYDVEVDNDTITITDGKLTAKQPDLTELKADETPAEGDTPAKPTGKVAEPTKPNSLVNASTVANAINNAFWTAKQGARVETNEDTSGVEDSEIKPGDNVTFVAGKNVALEKKGSTFTYATKDEVDFTNVTIGNVSMTKGEPQGDNNNVLNFAGPEAAPATLTGLTSGLTTYPADPATPASGLVNLTPEATKGKENNAVTVADLQKFGWIVSSNKTTGDDKKEHARQVKNAGEVKFVGTGLAQVSANTTGDVTTVTVSVEPDVPGVIEQLKNPADAAGVETNTGAVKVGPNDSAKVVNASTVADAINSSGFNVIADKTGSGENAGTAPAKKLINPSKTVKFTAGDNINIEQKNTDEGSEFIVKTSHNPVFENNVTIGGKTDAEGNKAPAVTLAAEKAIPANNNADAPTTALNVTSPDGKPSQILGVASALNKAPVATNPDGKADTPAGNVDFVDLANATTPNAVATVGDLQNMGWVVSANGNEYKDGVKNANEVKFNGEGPIKITGSTAGNVRNINVSVAVDDKTVKVVDGKLTAVQATDFNGSSVTNLKSNLPTTVNPDDTKNYADDARFEVLDAGIQLPAVNIVQEVGNNAATVKDVLASGWNLQENGKAVDHVKAYETVNFADGKGTTVKSETDNKTSKLTVDVKTDDETVEINKDGKVAAKTADLTVNNAGSVNEPAANSPAGKALVNASTVAKTINNVSHTVTTEKDDVQVTSNTNKPVKVKAGSTVKHRAGKNLEVAQKTTGNDTEITYGLSENIAVKSVTVGADGDKNPVVINNNGINAGGKRITNVAPGVAPTDAVNVSQLEDKIGGVNGRINKVDKKLRAGIAGTNAAATLPQVYIPGKSMVAAAAGTYRGESAIAVGYSRASDNGKLILKLQGNTNSRGDTGAGVGVGYQW
ncbi:hypothetical protein A4G18_01490 [Pasteurellaceae bacterium Pebbles2]|nr:hypothetical protein [Pasteurellaceae bacterium Pebbles2]